MHSWCFAGCQDHCKTHLRKELYKGSVGQADGWFLHLMCTLKVTLEVVTYNNIVAAPIPWRLVAGTNWGWGLTWGYYPTIPTHICSRYLGDSTEGDNLSNLQQKFFSQVGHQLFDLHHLGFELLVVGQVGQLADGRLHLVFGRNVGCRRIRFDLFAALCQRVFLWSEIRIRHNLM